MAAISSYHSRDRPPLEMLTPADKIRQGHAQNRMQSLPPPGSPPFGYKRGQDGYVIDRKQAPIVKEFFDHFLLYGSLRGAVRHIAQKFNKVIAVSTGRKWLTNPAYRGDLRYQAVNPPKTLRDTHKPIISRDEAAQIDRLLRRNKSLPSRTASAERSLAGLVFCGECQGKMIVVSAKSGGKPKANSKSYLYLRCLTCPKFPKCRGVIYEQVLQQTIHKVCTDLLQAVSGMGGSRLGMVKAQIEEAIATKRDIITQIPKLLQSGVLDPETADLRIYKLRTEIADLETKIAQLPPLNLAAIAQTVSIPQFWLDLSESERRFYFREFLRSIQINPSSDDWDLQLVFVF